MLEMVMSDAEYRKMPPEGKGMKPDELAVRLSETALAQALALQGGNRDWQGLALRVYLSGKGCDGFDYGVAFDALQTDDISFEHPGLTLVVDPKTLGFIAGSQVDWVDDDRGRGFVVDNPNHRKFRGKFYKLRTWQERLAYRPSPQTEGRDRS